jgi:hypothetical protein
MSDDGHTIDMPPVSLPAEVQPEALEVKDGGDEEAVPDGATAPEQQPGEWLCIAFMGHNEYTGYVTEIVRNGQPAYRVDLPEKLWGGNPLACVEYAATAWFSGRPVTEEFVRRAWEASLHAAEKRRRQEAEWRRADEQRALTAGEIRALDDDAWSGDDD